MKGLRARRRRDAWARAVLLALSLAAFLLPLVWTALASVGVQATPHERIDGALRLAHCVITLTTSERPVGSSRLGSPSARSGNRGRRSDTTAARAGEAERARGTRPSSARRAALLPARPLSSATANTPRGC